MNNCKLIVITFIVTALWDVILRIMSENYKSLPKFIQEYKFIEYLIPYFKKHTILAAALIAGFIGATTQLIIINIYKFPTNLKNIKYLAKFLFVSFIISGLYGFLMKATKLFPHLEETYYKNLGPIRGAIHDGVSGLFVQITLLVLFLFLNL
jgi:hypothetical protein